MLNINNIEIMRGTKVLLSEASACVFPKHRAGLVGRNGCGKSTLFALITGELQPDKGEISVPKDWTIATVAQETPGLNETALNYVLDGDRHYRDLEKEIQKATETNDGMRLAALQEQFEVAGGYTINSRAGSLLLGLGFSAEDFSRPVKDFSGGWRMRLNLAQALLCPSDLLLLDEPTNHLDLDTVMWLEDWLKGYQGTLIIISHDRDFLDNICTEIIHMDNQKLVTYGGNYSQFETERAQKIALETAMYEKQQKKLKHMQSFVEKFRYKATKAKQAQSRLKAIEKMEKIVVAQADSPFSFSFAQGDTLPDTLVRMEHVEAGYGETVILSDIKLNLRPGSRIGLLGRNGVGKSTFIKTLAGEIPPLSGTLSISKGVQIGYFAQHQLDYLDTTGTPLSLLTRLAPDKKELELRSFLGGFGFSGDKALEQVKSFSGGEKSRLALALIVWQKPNLLLLDEPTNHLDLQMREAIVIALSDFEGALMVVSHDRHLLRTTTDEFYLASEGRVQPFDGDLDSYHQYLTDLDRRKHEELLREKEQKRQEKPQNTGTKSREQKRLEAEKRQSLRPLKQEVSRLENEMTLLNSEKDEIEQALSDNSIYEESQKENLKTLLFRQAENQKKLEETEMAWLEKSQELENKQKELELS
ncbi:ribosomal protection-like ABC-F family protein [Succinimonas sp.]|uniref:ribosomal protection-like ABC-F family protein n=1 Tax=Succinimonas sp. TaxID=1936151 RepID=UPI003867C5D9